MENPRIVNQRWAVYKYGGWYFENDVKTPIRYYRPREGELVVVKGTPYFGGFPMLIHGYNNYTIEDLCAYAAQNATPGEIMIALDEERAARIAGDIELQDKIDLIKQSANKAIVFDNHAQLAEWMAGNVMPFDPPYYPADLKSGVIALFRETGIPDFPIYLFRYKLMSNSPPTIYQ